MGAYIFSSFVEQIDVDLQIPMPKESIIEQISFLPHLQDWVYTGGIEPSKKVVLFSKFLDRMLLDHQ